MPLVPHRRQFLLASVPLLSAAAAVDKKLPVEWRRYADPATEFPVVRLTDPAHASWLSSYYARTVQRKGQFLLFVGERDGQAVYRLDLKSGELREQRTSGGGSVDPRSLALLPDDRAFLLLEGSNLVLAPFAGRERVVYTAKGEWQPTGGVSVSEDGLYAAFTEIKGKRERIQFVTLRTGAGKTLAEAAEPLRGAQIRPKRASVLYQRGNDLMLVTFDAVVSQKLKLGEGEVSSPQWSADGRLVHYLLRTEQGRVSRLCEHTPDTAEDKVLTRTSQFVQMSRNGDSSVFVGVSGSQAQPHVLLLLRSVKRELTLAEHKCSKPPEVNAVFSPNSQRVFFETDRDGRPALYQMQVERLVEETES
jgi:oligogalacturonide lyase